MFALPVPEINLIPVRLVVSGFLFFLRKCYPQVLIVESPPGWKKLLNTPIWLRMAAFVFLTFTFLSGAALADDTRAGEIGADGVAGVDGVIRHQGLQGDQVLMGLTGPAGAPGPSGSTESENY